MIDLNTFLQEQAPPEDAEPSNSRVRISRDELKQRLDFYAGLSDDFEVTDEQLDALEAIFSDHHNVFITGGAGTGKTTFVRSVVMPELDFRNLHWSVTATTGIAGSHLEGKTMHSFFGVGRGPEWKDFYPKKLKEFLEGVTVGEDAPGPQDMSQEELEGWYAMFFDEWMNDPRTRNSIRQGVIKRLQGHEVLIIDEISMCNGNGLLGYLDYMLRQLRHDDRPFGNLQVIFVGDFAQLPPVEDNEVVSKPDWAFLSHCWRSGKVKPIELTQVFRQGEPEFIRFLNNIRVGRDTQEDREFARRYVRDDMTQEETRFYTFLVPTNNRARKINLNALENYPEPTYPLEAEFQVVPEIQNVKEWEAKNVERVKEQLVKSMRLVERVTFVREGTPVMFTVNDPNRQFVNGTRGFVREVSLNPRPRERPEDTDYVVVGVPSMNPEEEERRVVLRRWPYSRERKEDPQAMVGVPPGFNDDFDMTLPPYISKYPTVRQFPLIPATAITIHKCVDKSTLIPTNSGMGRIGNICNGSSMPQVHGLTGLTESREPFVGGVEAGYRITTRRGYSVVCSERHPLLRVDDHGPAWVKSPQLKVGDVLRMRGATHAYGDGSLPDLETPEDYYTHGDYKLPSVLSTDLSWLLGVLIGGGCVSDKKDGRVDVTSMDWCVLNRFADVMKSEFGLTATLKPKPTSKARVSYVHNWGVRRWLVSLGLSHDTASDKSVPEVILTGSLEQQAAFLRGYFDTDGGVNTAVHVTSTSRRLIGEVHLMLLNMGIVGTIAPMKKAWRINITGVDIVKFRDAVGFSIPYKSAACNDRAPDHRQVPKVQSGFYPVEYGRSLAAMLRSDLIEVYPGRRSAELGFGDKQYWAWFLSRVYHGKCGISDVHLAAMYRDLPKCADASPECARVFSEASSGCFLDEIVSIEPEEGDMRDICVPEGHAFVGNGFVNHNSQGMSMDRAILALSSSFAAGQVYVGLSRLRSPQGMVLAEEDFEVKVDPYVMEYYQSIKDQKTKETVTVP